MYLVVTQTSETKREKRGTDMFINDSKCRVQEIFLADFLEILSADAIGKVRTEYNMHVSPAEGHADGFERSFYPAFASARDILMFTGNLKREIETSGVAVVLFEKHDEPVQTLYIVCAEF